LHKRSSLPTQLKSQVMKKAILFGASGFVGSHLLNELLKDKSYEQIIIIVRKAPDVQHPKLKMLIGDYHSLPALKEQLVADEIFIALGTTKRNTPDRDQYYVTDHDYPVLAAKIAREQGAQSIFIVTAVGSNAASRFFYIRTKGETERDILALDFGHTHIFQPSMILGRSEGERPLESFLNRSWRAIDPIFRGKWNKYKGIDGKDIARAMRKAAKTQTDKVGIYHWQEMKTLADLP
jgi:uncharacterized protein YbjT (DUF2867 family)